MSQKFICIISPNLDSTVPTTTITTDPIHVKIWVGIEKRVQFKGNQEEGEELANRYVHASQGLYDLEHLMKNSNPEDVRMLSWNAEWTQKLQQLREFQVMPQIIEFTSIIREQQQSQQIDELMKQYHATFTDNTGTSTTQNLQLPLVPPRSIVEDPQLPQVPPRSFI